MNLLYPYLFILFPVTSVFTVVLFIISRYKGYVEEEPIGEIRTISPALKIVKLIFSKTVGSIEILIILISLYFLTIMASSVASYAYSMNTVNLEGKPHLFDVAGVGNTIDVIGRIAQTRYTIVIVQVYRALIVSVNNETLLFYPLLIECSRTRNSGLVGNAGEHIELLIDLCKTLELGNVVILNKNLSTLVRMVNLDFMNYTTVGMDLRLLPDLELVPGLYILHSIGNMGGEVIKLEDVNRIALFRFTQGNFDLLCRNKCDVKTIALYIDVGRLNSLDLDSTIDEYKHIFNYIIVRRGNTGMIYSSTFVPTSESLVGLLMLFLISIIILLSLSGGLIEKLSHTINKLWSIGVSKELYGASSTLTLTIIFGIGIAPVAVCHYIEWLNSFGLVAYLIMSTVTVFVLSNQLIRRLNVVQRIPHRSSITYISESYIDVENLRGCLTQLLHSDDVFHLNEIEVLKNSKYYVLRVEMVYGRALSTIAVSEIYVEGYDSLWRYVIEVDVWSIEEFTAREVKYITLLALSKMYGGLASCLEKLP